MPNPEIKFEQTARLECLKLLSGHIQIDCRVDPNKSLPVDNQVLANLNVFLKHSDALFRYVMVGDPIIEYLNGGGNSL
jgi:hypothetical protein